VTPSSPGLTDTPAEAERLLAELGVRRIPIPVPFAEAGGPANVYAIEEHGGGVALFDSGIDTPTGERRLREGLESLGLSFRDVRRIFLSHGHVDHYGLARAVSEASGAPVHVHAADRLKVERPSEWSRAAREAWQGYARRLGATAADVDAMERSYERTIAYARPVEHTQPLHPGESLSFARFDAEVLHAPGHTPGLVCLSVPGHRLLFSDDHLLERVSPNPILEIGPEGETSKFRALPTYVRTLQETRRLDLDIILPGHDAPFRGHVKVIDSLLGFYEKRQQKLLVRLGEGAADGLALTRFLFPRIGPSLLFLALSETVGNLELLEDRGLVVRRVVDGLHRWEPAR
jgi:glyoxylase-like metal-dependent hydrolase (beta-lactamase superfamily II)